MAAQPASTVPTISPAEMQILISRAGLVLNPGQMADLVLAWRQVAGLIAAIPQGRKLADDMALTFRLPPPADADAAARPVVSAAVKPTARSASKAAPRPQRKPAKKALPAKKASPVKTRTTRAKAAASPAKAAAKAKPKARTRRPALRGR